MTKSIREKLQIQSDYWDKLKTEIEAVRNKGYENTDIVNMSEIYFTMADETVSCRRKLFRKNRCKDSYHRAFCQHLICCVW